MVYKCKECNYECSVKYNYDKHLETDKHKSNVKLKNMKLNNCEFCQECFSSASGLSRHKNSCGIKVKLLNENETLKTEIIRLQNEINLFNDKFTAQNVLLNDKITAQNVLIKKLKQAKKNSDMERDNITKSYLEFAVTNRPNVNISGPVNVSTNAATFVQNNFLNTPIIHPFNDTKLLGDNDLTIAEDAIYYHKKKKCNKYIGDVIIKVYKKDDPAIQSVWNTDSARLAYLVRELIGMQPGWSIDKEGIKTGQYLITPILTYINDVLAKYMKTQEKLIGGEDDVEILRKMSDASNLIKSIDDQSLIKETLKYLAPHFHLDQKSVTKRIDATKKIITDISDVNDCSSLQSRNSDEIEDNDFEKLEDIDDSDIDEIDVIED
ncbi:MAG: zinc finger protein [Harvfovirus sp.]|uniref:Zinc finger protein n=1 Tax=Harvfovirus sp. TaxID=2487768 RepID=A0A3G5A2B1_9VIRU|nr:MAG: zinc finger protein [Harvfovirus sp.]